MAEGDADPTRAVSDVLTDQQLRAWARDVGFDLDHREDLLDAAAVGMTTIAWRNTRLETIHGSAELHALPSTDAARDHALERAYAWDERLRHGKGSVGMVADPDELPRLARFVEGRRHGCGIPDDIMLRVNVATVTAVRAALDGAIPDDYRTDTAMPTDPVVPPAWLRDTLDVVTEPAREMTVGAATLTVLDVIGERSWEKWVRGIEDKLNQRTDAFVVALGSRRALWFVALSGFTYSSEWFPTPAWGRAVAGLRRSVATGTPEDASWVPHLVGPFPDPDDDAFWDALTRNPARLSGAQAHWVTLSRLRDFLTAERENDRQRLGPLHDTDRFPIIHAHF